MLGQGVWELELHVERARDDEGGATMRRSDVLAKLGYGIARNADVEVELPYVRELTGDAVVEGRGDVGLSVKWRFHQKDRFSLAFRPKPRSIRSESAYVAPTTNSRPCEPAAGSARLSWP